MAWSEGLQDAASDHNSDFLNEMKCLLIRSRPRPPEMNLGLKCQLNRSRNILSSGRRAHGSTLDNSPFNENEEVNTVIDIRRDVRLLHEKPIKIKIVSWSILHEVFFLLA